MVFELQARWRLYLFNLVHTPRDTHTRHEHTLRDSLSANVTCYILCRTPLAELESTLDASDSHRTTMAGSRHIDPRPVGSDRNLLVREERPKRSLYTSVPCSAAALSSPAFSSAALPAHRRSALLTHAVPAARWRGCREWPEDGVPPPSAERHVIILGSFRVPEEASPTCAS